MKNKYLILGVSLLTLVSCGETKESTAISESSKESSIVSTSSNKVEESSTFSADPSKTYYTATFKADGKEVSTVQFEEGSTTLSEPNVPAKNHYDGAWEAYTLSNADLTINAIYTAINYDAIFMANGEEIEKITYNADNYSEKSAPDVPSKDKYKGSWSPAVDFSNLANQTYTATYEVDLKTKNGGFDYNEGYYVAKDANSLAIDPNISFTSGTLRVGMVKSSADEDSGVVFGLTYSGEEMDSYWEGEGVSYYFFFVSQVGEAVLGKTDNGNWQTIAHSAIYDYNEESEYPLAVSLENGLINCFVGDTCMITYKDDNALTGTGVGYRAGKAKTKISCLAYSEDVLKDSKQVIPNCSIVSGAATASEGVYTITDNNTIIMDENLSMKDNYAYETTITSGQQQDAGIVFGINAGGSRSFFEDANVPYYFFFINLNGDALLAHVGGDPVWNTLVCDSGIKDYSPYRSYNLKVTTSSGFIKCYVDDVLLIRYDTGEAITGNVGVRAQKSNARFTAITETAHQDPEFEWYLRNGAAKIDENGNFVTSSDGTLAYLDNKQFEAGKGGSFSCDILISGAGTNVGLCFGTDDKAKRWTSAEFYTFWVDWAGNACLATDIDPWKCDYAHAGIVNESELFNGYGVVNNYKIEFDGVSKVKCYINGNLLFDAEFSGNSIHNGIYVGIIAQGTNTSTYSNFVFEANE